MPEQIFKGIFDTTATQVISVGDFLLCMGVALVLGLALATVYRFRSRCSGSFAVTLVLLPAVVCVVIMLVNGNVGTGVAVAGAFSLVRFRSVPGSAREICALFLAMGAGLITGMGYLAYGVLFTAVMCGAYLACTLFRFGRHGAGESEKLLHITIPEDLDYSGVFDDIFAAFTTSHELLRVKTTNMGSMFRLTYRLTLKDTVHEKEMIDQLRCRNGNLEIMLTCQESPAMEL